MNFVLVGKFSHGRPPLRLLRNSLWISSVAKHFCRISIYSLNWLQRVWLKLIWNIKGFSMRVFKWNCEFSPQKESAIAPVWIRLEGVPLYMFDEASLLSIANAIGTPFKS
ncbi:hypothetical protein Leryth_024556 [Lithospermum erythrorhizon]|nr:hypothetical protein Leryth_024556 [Lithospermum erythrorhizon]